MWWGVGGGGGGCSTLGYPVGLRAETMEGSPYKGTQTKLPTSADLCRSFSQAAMAAFETMVFLAAKSLIKEEDAVKGVSEIQLGGFSLRRCSI